ncbi:hypothetical protein L1281_001732 [Neisseria sp. HSC-16F19]|nr:antitoxin VbhA family protein [Neisseria sp. HSC-16F19]MCP2041138.1 hypothetical protein [Neisseria sp. HSC-16F19]
MNIKFLPETTPEAQVAIKNAIGSWKMEGLEISQESVTEVELCILGKLSYDEAVKRAIERAINDE